MTHRDEILLREYEVCQQDSSAKNKLAININNQRTCDIEKETKIMDKNHMVEDLDKSNDDWEKLPNSRKRKLSKLRERRPRLTGYPAKGMFRTLISLWVVFIILGVKPR